MSNFPTSLDDDTTLPFVNDNITEIGEEAVNALRDAVFALEQNVGIGAAGSTLSLTERLGVSIDGAGAIKSSALTSLGLVTLPITNVQIAANAEIPESKLKLDYRTQDLYNYIRDLSSGVNLAVGWISVTGIKLDPHLLGAIYRHTLNQIDVASDPAQYLKNRFRTYRNNSDSYQLINDINNEFLNHQFSDGITTDSIQNITTNGGSTYPSNYAHTASGVFLNARGFTTIPQTATDLQLFADFIDSASIFLLGTRIQNLYSNGISKVSRSSSLLIDGYGSAIVPSTPAIAYLLHLGADSSPFDDIDAGDDIIEFKPAATDMSSNKFDAQFSQVKIGDIVRINYGSIEVQFIIKEKKYIQSGGSKKYIIRIAGKNLFYSAIASARIDKPLFNSNKGGVLSIAPANNNFNVLPSLIIGSPRGAEVLGVGFNADLLDSKHYLLYLSLYPDGNPVTTNKILPAIDVTGNLGITPGKYTIDSVVENINNAFRQNGFNYRFIAFQKDGDIGIMLADSYHNAGFSIIDAVVKSDGTYDQTATELNYPNNVIDLFAVDPIIPVDPLGFGPSRGNVSSPPYTGIYGSAEAAQLPTKVFLPLKRNNYYINGVEKERLNLEPLQLLDENGDGHWNATITDRQVFPGAAPVGRVQTTYRVLLDLSTSGLKVGKTLVIQSGTGGSIVDFGRFIIKELNYSCATPTVFTDITVFDSVHGSGSSPVDTLGVGGVVNIYFSSDSVAFNAESATDFTSVSPFKRHFETYIDQNALTFTHERARINISGGTLTVNTVPLYSDTNLSKLNIVKVSPKLRGYQFGSVNKITLNCVDYSDTTGIFSGQLASYDGVTFTHKGPVTSGKKGEVIRFYDETNVDYIDIIFELESVIGAFAGTSIDFQLFPTLSLDDEIMLLGTCQLNDSTKIVNYIRDERQFGNTSEKDLSTSALNYIALPEKILHANGVARGFDLQDSTPNPNAEQIFLTGGTALVNGKFVQLNNETVVIPIIKEKISSTLYNMRWALCVNDKGEYQSIPLLDYYEGDFTTPSDPARIFQAYNPITGLTYYLDGTTFVDLIEKRKELTVLYIVYSIVDSGVSPATITLVVQDARRYINDGELNAPLVLCSDVTQGDFHTIEAVNTWISLNPTCNKHVIVRGSFTISSITTFDYPTLGKRVIFEGDSGKFVVTTDHGIKLGSNVEFYNMEFVYAIFNTTVSTADWVNNGHGIIYRELGFGEELIEMSFRDCMFTIKPELLGTLVGKWPYININLKDSNTFVGNLFITNCRMEAVNSSDFYAAIAIVNSSPQITLTYIPVLNNVLIQNNILEAEQLIVLTTIYREDQIKDAGLACVNVLIDRNVCGSIGGITTSAMSGSAHQKSGLLTISNNTCKFIGNLSSLGKFIDVFDIGINTLNVTNNTGNVLIDNNKCSFIYYGLQSPAFAGATSLNIVNNKLTSNIVYGTPHATDYLNNFDYSPNAKRFAIYVSADPSGSAYARVNVSSNRTEGIDSTGYEALIRNCASGNIISNYLEGIFDAVTLSDYEYSGIIYDGLNPGLITNNYISRQGTSTGIYAYITTRWDISDAANSGFAVITENTFDTTTTDGSLETLGKDSFGTDLAWYWTYERNVNQTKYAVVRSISGSHSWADLTYPIFVRPIIIGNVPSGQEITIANNSDLAEYNIEFNYSAGASAVRHHFWYVSLREVLPLNVVVLGLTTSAVSDVTASVSGSKTKLSLYYDDALVTVTGTDTVVYTGGYVPGTVTGINIAPVTLVRNNDLGNGSFLIQTDIGHSATAKINVENVTIKYRW